MARGSIAKAEITQKILNSFENSFVYDKEIRIPFEENGEIVQIKCVLTCAKVNVENGGNTLATDNTTTNQPVKISTLTEQEKQETAELLASLGL